MQNKPIQLNGAIFTLCKILKIVTASMAKSKLGTLFMNMKKGRALKELTLEELGCPRPAIPIHCDNAIALGIVDVTVK